MIERIHLPMQERGLSRRWRQRLIALAIIVGQFGLTAVLVARGSKDLLTLIPVLLIGLAGALILMRWLPLGFVMLTFVGIIVPGTWAGEVNATVILMGGIIALWLADMFIVQRRLYISPSPVLTPLMALLVVSLLAFIFGLFDWFAPVEGAPLDAQVGGLAIFVLSFGITIATATTLRNIRWLEAMTWIFILFGAGFIFARVVPGLWSYARYIYQPQAMGGIFFAWLPAMTLSQSLFNKKLNPGLRDALGLVAFGAVYVAFVQNFGWKSGWITVSIVIALLLVLRQWRFLIPLTAGAALVGTILAADVLATEDYSISTRFDALLIMADMIKVNPFFGLGFSNYYWYTPLYAIRGWSVNFNSHNNFVDIVAQIGLVGLGLLTWFFGALGLLAWRLRTRVPEGFPRAFVYGALAGLVGSVTVAFLGDWLLPFVYNIGMSGVRTAVLFWIFAGGLVALGHIYGDDEASRSLENSA